MLLSDLEKKLIKLKVPKDCYSLKGGLPNESLCLSYVEGIWEIYYSEKGNKTGLNTYDNESDACEAFLIKIKKMMKL